MLKQKRTTKVKKTKSVVNKISKRRIAQKKPVKQLAFRAAAPKFDNFTAPKSNVFATKSVFTTQTMNIWTSNNVPLNGPNVEGFKEGPDAQRGKYGEQKIPQLFQTDTPNFKSILKTVDFNSQNIAERPAHNLLTSEEFCAKFGIIPVKGDVAHCVGTPDGPHPQEFIQVFNANPTKPSACKYCGLQYIKQEYIKDMQNIFTIEQ
eukprot:UN00342